MFVFWKMKELKLSFLNLIFCCFSLLPIFSFYCSFNFCCFSLFSFFYRFSIRYKAHFGFQLKILRLRQKDSLPLSHRSRISINVLSWITRFILKILKSLQLLIRNKLPQQLNSHFLNFWKSVFLLLELKSLHRNVQGSFSLF